MSRSISDTKRQLVFARDRYSCVYCGVKAEYFQFIMKKAYPYVSPRLENGSELEIDHVYPVIHGGSDDINNLVTACWRCNNSKSTRLWNYTPKMIIILDKYRKRRKSQIN